jgi:hypothetical protein
MRPANGKLRIYIKTSIQTILASSGFIDMRAAHGFCLESRIGLSSNRRAPAKG